MRCIQKVSNSLFLLPKLMPHRQNPLGGRWLLPSCTCVTIFLLVGYISCSCYAKNVDRTSWEIASCFAKKLGDTEAQTIEKIQPLAMNPGAKFRSRCGTTTSNMSAPQWRARRNHAGHSQVKTRSLLRRSSKTVV